MSVRSLLFTTALAAVCYGGSGRAAETPAAGPASTNLAATDTNLVDMVMTQTNMDALDDRQKLGPGDRVMYQVIQDQDPSRTLIVTDAGDLEVPYYGLVSAADKTCRQLAREIKALLEKKLYYQATVILALEVANRTLVTGKVYVTGQVRQPGSLEIPAKESLTVSKAIVSAGGFSDFSDKKHVRLIRQTSGGEETYIINVVAVWAGHVEKDLSIQPGDIVVVPQRLVNY